MRAPALATASAMSNATSPPRPPRRACSRPGSIRPRHIAANGDRLAACPDSCPPHRGRRFDRLRLGRGDRRRATCAERARRRHDPWRARRRSLSQSREPEEPGDPGLAQGQGRRGGGAAGADRGARCDGKADAELAAASGDSVSGVVRMPGGRVFFLRRKSGETQFKLVMRSGAGAAERVLVDPEAMSRSDGVPRAINYFRPSWDGKLVAYGISAGGSENAALEVIESDTGRRVGATIPRVREPFIHWTPDNRHLSFNQVRELAPATPETETFLDTDRLAVRAGSRRRRADAALRPAGRQDARARAARRRAGDLRCRQSLDDRAHHRHDRSRGPHLRRAAGGARRARRSPGDRSRAPPTRSPGSSCAATRSTCRRSPARHAAASWRWR